MAWLLQSERAFPWRVFLIAFVVRLVPVLLSIHLAIGLDDMFQYDMLARSLASGNGFRWYNQADLHLIQKLVNIDTSSVQYDPRGVLTTFRAPLYPAFLALIYRLVGSGSLRFFAARLVQAAVGALLIPLTFALARRLFPEDERIARWAAWGMAFYPMLVIFPLALATENLFFILFLASLLSLVLAAQTRRTRYFLLAGFLLGLTALTRSSVLSVAALVVLWGWFLLRLRAKTLFFLLALLLTVFPWVLRNSLLTGRPTGIETSLGYNLYVGYYPQGTGTFDYGPSLDLLTILNDQQRDQIGTQKALAFIKADPARVVQLCVWRLAYFFGLERKALTYFYSNDFFGFIPLPLLLLMTATFLLPFVCVSLSATLGLALLRWDRTTLLLPLVIVGYLVPYALILSEDRFHLALVPLFAILAARCWSGGLDALRARWRASHGGKIALLLAVLGVLLLASAWNWDLARNADKIIALFGPLGNLTYYPY